MSYQLKNGEAWIFENRYFVKSGSLEVYSLVSVGFGGDPIKLTPNPSGGYFLFDKPGGRKHYFSVDDLKDMSGSRPATSITTLELPEREFAVTVVGSDKIKRFGSLESARGFAADLKSLGVKAELCMIVLD